MAKYTFLDLAIEVARSMPEPMSTTQMWEFATKRGLTRKLDTVGKTPDATFGARVYGSLGDPNSPFTGIGARPVLIWLKERGQPPKAAASAASPKPEKAPGPTLHERQLHPLVAYVARTRLDGVRVKTIRHEQSTKKSFGEWVHPDLIGFRFQFPRLSDATARFHAEARASRVTTVSIELKRTIDFGNLRESFFQAVSNSSWANEGYLAAISIADDPELRTEIDRLSTSFGIGILLLDVASPDDSRVLWPARRKDDIDWVTLDKLAVLNSDVRDLLKTVASDLKAEKVHDSEYDGVAETADELAKPLKNWIG